MDTVQRTNEENVAAMKTRGDNDTKKTYDASSLRGNETLSGVAYDVCVAGVAGGLNVKRLSYDIPSRVLFSAK